MSGYRLVDMPVRVTAIVDGQSEDRLEAISCSMRVGAGHEELRFKARCGCALTGASWAKCADHGAVSSMLIEFGLGIFETSE